MNLESLLLAGRGALSQGVILGIMVIGVYITFKVLDYADLTVDGSFATGGAVSAVMIMQGYHPFLTLVFATLSGLAAGFVTGILHTKLKIPAILSGILSQLGLYSINVRIMGKANLTLLGVDTVMSNVQKWLPFNLSKTTASLILGVVMGILIIVLLYWFFGTEIGSAIRATGNNEYMVRALGVNTDTTKILGLMISNGLVALSGALFSQSQGYADVGMGTGTIVSGLASIIIGEVIFGNRFSFFYKLMAVVFGSVIYRIIIALVLQMGMKSTDLKLLTALLVALALAIPVFKDKILFIVKKYHSKYTNRKAARPGTKNK